jgi:hypothetical protein
MKYIKAILLLLIVFVVGCDAVSEAEPVELDERCNWEPGRCLSQGKGYRYSSYSQQCVYYDNDACTDAPFETMEECEEICMGK